MQMYSTSLQHDEFSPSPQVLSRCLSRWIRCSVFGSLNLTTVKLSGVGSSFRKHAEAESKGIKAHFNMDESGVLLLDRVSSWDHSYQ